MVLDLGQPSDDADEDRLLIDTKLLPKRRASRSVIRKHTEIEAERNDLDLSLSPNAEIVSNLGALLRTHDDQSIRNQSRQQPLDRQKNSCPAAPIITVKNVAVIRVHKLAPPRSADERSRRQPAIKEARNTPDRSGLRRVRVNDVGPFAQKQPKQFPDRDDVLQRDLAAHFGNVERLHTRLVREVAHIFFARGNRTRNE